MIRREVRMKRRAAWLLVWGLVAILLSYPLSMGPMVRSAAESGDAEGLGVYRPIWKAAHYPVIGKTVAAYLNRWLPATWEAAYESESDRYDGPSIGVHVYRPHREGNQSFRLTPS